MQKIKPTAEPLATKTFTKAETHVNCLRALQCIKIKLQRQIRLDSFLMSTHSYSS